MLLVATALALVLTIDRALNAIWRVRQPRPFGQRVLVYWAALTLGPLALGMSVTLTSYAVSASRGLVSALLGGVAPLLDRMQFALLAATTAGLFHYVPNTAMRWRHAWAGGLFVRWPSSWRSSRWPGTSIRCPRIPPSTARWRRCPSCCRGSTSAG